MIALHPLQCLHYKYFHKVVSDGRECIVDIETLKIIGKISVREIRDALNWIEIERKFLGNEWQRCNA
jgi:hypothetical protein